MPECGGSRWPWAFCSSDWWGSGSGQPGATEGPIVYARWPWWSLRIGFGVGPSSPLRRTERARFLLRRSRRERWRSEGVWAAEAHASGRATARARLTAKLTIASTTSRMVQVFSASISVSPPILAKIQKPLSFIHEPTREPAPIEVAR